MLSSRAGVPVPRPPCLQGWLSTLPCTPRPKDALVAWGGTLLSQEREAREARAPEAA